MIAPRVAVLMPTLGTRKRTPLLRRALASVVSQEGVHVTPIVVFNGPDVDSELVEEVRGTGAVRTLRLPEAGLPAALRAGRRLVEDPLLSELDDDDELLPGALALRAAALEARPECGAVVTNGIRRGGHGDELHLRPDDDLERDPLREMLRRNWLLPGSWLCRSAVLPESVFARMPSYLENTYLGLTLATAVRIAFVLDRPTMVYHEDTPDSVSKSVEYLLGQEGALARILELDLPADVRRDYENRLGPACHAAAAVLAERGDRTGAWKVLRRSFSYSRDRHALRATAKVAMATVRR